MSGRLLGPDEPVLVVPELVTVTAEGTVWLNHLPSADTEAHCTGDCLAHETTCGVLIGAPGGLTPAHPDTLCAECVNAAP
ncbi:hypothetical protein [Cellulosimicrobium sp. Marseille-Q4280]|uniref:hypothetical protein n=1 Tax=Cellulosimicrobium sp. Marseille-Q4280 TaxID=2937992 RepID=UPI00203BFFAC|nr:hypothetical protein [Cellulosimicrobium sp. Marseille-Q4280]